jgi:hypothetical protein
VVDRPPVKRQTGFDAVGPGARPGTTRSWIVNGTDILNP